ncbi:MAG: helix-turn-helix domain-containing protein [Patulibacter sp.]
MAEIGVTLREARMRAGIDIAEVEARTKIRAKYLRALENEEWSLLPGTTFVKSFLRTYAEALGLDAKLLVEEYKFRHEPYEVGGSGVVQRQNGRRGRRGKQGAFGPQKRSGWIPLVGLVVLIAALLFAVFQMSKGEDESNQPPPAATTTAADGDTEAADEQAAAERRRKQREAAGRIVSLRVAATASTPTFVCIRDARGRRVVNGRTLQQGRRTSVLRSQRFDVAIGAPSVRLTDGGRRLQVRADSRNVIAYRITKDELKRLPEGQRPSCSS